MVRISTKELRIQPGKIIDQVAHGEEITVTFRGRPLAKIVPIKRRDESGGEREADIFGMWANHESVQTVEDTVRKLRAGRQF
jgi:prevent-host-death family protein